MINGEYMQPLFAYLSQLLAAHYVILHIYAAKRRLHKLLIHFYGSLVSFWSVIYVEYGWANNKNPKKRKKQKEKSHSHTHTHTTQPHTLEHKRGSNKSSNFFHLFGQSSDCLPFFSFFSSCY